MALFNYFPNYVWNLSIAIALESGAQMGEIMDMCAPLLAKAGSGADVGTADFLAAWVEKAEILVGLADEDERRDRLFSAADKLHRAALYYLIAERMQGHGTPGRLETYRQGKTSFARAVAFTGESCERVEIPYQGKIIPAFFTRAQGGATSAPAVIYLNGLDSCKELLYWSRLPHELARRGISCLCVDQPGTGEALREQGLPATAEAELWGTPVFDALASRHDVDAARIGITGISLGGYYAPRICANEPRIASGAVWGANHDWAEVQQRRRKREGENPVPHYWSHVQWVFGAADEEDFFKRAEGMTLDGQMEKIRVPFLVTHGEQDRQISIEYAHRSYAQLIHSPRRELKIFTSREGGVEHVGCDNMSFGRHFIADWFAETLGGRTKLDAGRPVRRS